MITMGVCEMRSWWSSRQEGRRGGEEEGQNIINIDIRLRYSPPRAGWSTFTCVVMDYLSLDNGQRKPVILWILSSLSLSAVSRKYVGKEFLICSYWIILVVMTTDHQESWWDGEMVAGCNRAVMVSWLHYLLASPLVTLDPGLDDRRIFTVRLSGQC